MADGYYGIDEGFENANKGDPLFSVKQIGTTHAITEGNALTQLKAEIFRGAGNIEMSANGYGRPGQGLGKMTFEAIDPLQRQAIAELARINEVNITTHATFQAGNLSGFNPQSGFSQQYRKSNIDEIKKAIDFSAEAANGGSVVVHTGEFPRPIGVDKSEGGYKNGKYEFESFADEEKEAQFYLVNEKTGDIIKSVKSNEVIVRPIYRDDGNGQEEILRDENNRPMYDDVFREDIIIRYRQKHQIPENEKDDNAIWQSLSEDQRKEAHIKIFDYDPQTGNIKTKPITFEEYKEEEYAKGKDLKGVIKGFFKEQMQGQIQNALGSARQFEQEYKRGLDEIKEAKESYQAAKKLKDNWNGTDQQWRESVFTQMNIPLSKVKNANGELADPLELFSDQARQAERKVLYGRETGISGRKQAKELLRQINEAQTIDEYAIKNSINTMVELGKYAIKQTESARHDRKHDTIKQIALTLENIFPENGYGSHPEELAELVKKGRKALRENLVEAEGMSNSEAKELADDTLKITLDTGHLNIWRKYFKAKEGESKAKTDKRFKEWYTQQVDKLAEEGLIGNMHIADNLGWDDAHLAAGTGNAPVREVMEILKKHGYDDVVTSEGGFDRGPSGEFGLQSTWHMAGATAFKAGSYAGQPGGDEAWLNPNGGALYNVMEGYHGAPGGDQGGYSTQIQKPNFVFKGYAPDSEDWRPWSGSGME